ncbi:MAG TPA: methylated-DNA--[protein]-cysteine S-methyltransferase [Candidatus Paceibacterota bacterium]|nr:methylated-DNA--[protein]-cysteine S-methyltransferase [Candidatus Paceibacterota bacterium]
MKSQFVELPVSTRDGIFFAHYSEKGLAGLDFPNGRADLPLGQAARRRRPTQQNAVPAKIRKWHRATESALKNILGGSKPKKFPPLDLAGTEFQKGVWNALRKISIGKTKSYGEIADAIGKPKAVRAVGGACGANPVPVLVPCHRVLAANKKPGGFSGGLDWKRSLLAREGIKFLA